MFPKWWINSDTYFVYLFSCFISSWMCWKRMVPCHQPPSCTNTTSKMHKRQQFIDQWLYCYQRNAHLYFYVHTALATRTFKKLSKDIDECLMQYQGLLKVLGSVFIHFFYISIYSGILLWKMKNQLISTFSRMDVVLHFISNIFIMLAIHLPFIYLPDMMAQKGNISSKESR